MADLLPITQAPLNKARKDKFQLILTIPNVLKGLNARNIREEKFLNLDSLQFSVFGINIPNSIVPEIPLHYAGQNYNVTSFDRPAYPPCTVNFTVDNEFKNYWVLWKWLQLLNDPLNSTYGGPEIFKEGGYPKLEPKTLYDYTTTITVNAMDEYNNVKTQFEFRNAFIKRLSEYSYNYRDPEEIECSFDFVFNQMDIHLI
jgi:hypothetical protein